MKKFYLILGLLALVCLSYSQDAMEFTDKKPHPDGASIYFHVSGLNDESHAETIVNDLLDDPNISFARYFVSSSGKDRFHIHCSENITPEYIRNVLLTNNVDYDFSTVSRNGIVENKAEHANTSINNHSTRQSVNAPGFPQFKDTGNPEKDESEYAQKKQEWINENPDTYQELINDLNPNTENKIVISKKEFDNMSKEKQNELLNNPDKFIIK
jgi:hypothetical protein